MLEFAASKEEFKEVAIDVLDTAQQTFPDVSDVLYQVQQDLRDDRIEIRLTEDDKLAAVVAKNREVEAFQLNTDVFSKYGRDKFEHTVVHEICHIANGLKNAHDMNFYFLVESLLKDWAGSIDRYQEHFEWDILVNADKRSVSLDTFFSDPVFLTTRRLNELMNDMLELVLKAFDVPRDMNQNILEVLEEFEFDISKQYMERIQKYMNSSGRITRETDVMGDDGAKTVLKLNQGRGRNKLELVEIDMKTGEWKVINRDAWFQIKVNDIEATVDVIKTDIDLETLDMEGPDLNSLLAEAEKISEGWIEFAEAVSESFEQVNVMDKG